MAVARSVLSFLLRLTENHSFAIAVYGEQQIRLALVMFLVKEQYFLHFVIAFFPPDVFCFLGPANGINDALIKKFPSKHLKYLLLQLVCFPCIMRDCQSDSFLVLSDR